MRIAGCLSGLSETLHLILCRSRCTELFQKSNTSPIVELFLESYRKPPRQIILDLDVTDDLVHGNQEETFFNPYYRGYCYAPLYIFCGKHLLAAKLRP